MSMDKVKLSEGQKWAAWEAAYANCGEFRDAVYAAVEAVLNIERTEHKHAYGSLSGLCECGANIQDALAGKSKQDRTADAAGQEKGRCHNCKSDKSCFYQEQATNPEDIAGCVYWESAQEQTEVCPHCGPDCLGGAAHNARMEDKVMGGIQEQKACNHYWIMRDDGSVCDWCGARAQPSGDATTKTVDALCADIADRHGLKWEWEKIDDDAKEEIKKAWAEIIKSAVVREGYVRIEDRDAQWEKAFMQTVCDCPSNAGMDAFLEMVRAHLSEPQEGRERVEIVPLGTGFHGVALDGRKQRVSFWRLQDAERYAAGLRAEIEKAGKPRQTER